VPIANTRHHGYGRAKAEVGVSFDDRVGPNEQAWWNVDPKCLCSLQVDNEFEFGRLSVFEFTHLDLIRPRHQHRAEI
jgi:hypothetical protein